MPKLLIKHIKKAVYLFVFAGSNAAFSGSFEDFFKAAKMDDERVVKQLIARGFDVNTMDPNGQNGLMIALREPSPKVAALLVHRPGINLNAPNAKGETVLMLAAFAGQLDIAETMIKKGADVNKTGWTPLHYAASSGQLALVRLLLENHAYIDAESPNASTPLMMASMYGTLEAVKLLIDEGADSSLKNQQNLTALQFAQLAKRDDVAQLIMKAERAAKAGKPPGQW